VNDTIPEIDWHLTTWEGSREEQQRRWAKLSLEEILDAQEEMAKLAEELQWVPENNQHEDPKEAPKND
jgi:hypothetical protein